MQFTYSSYVEVIEKLKKHKYEFSNYQNWKKSERCVIFRHDIDFSIDKAVELAAIEKNEGVSATYFVLLTSDFYNVFSKESLSGLEKILMYDHEIGLHFDEEKYSEIHGDADKIRYRILEEADLLGKAVGLKIESVSMHRPSRIILEADLQIPGITNSYAQLFFKNFKYLSDSRRRWREPVEKIIEEEQYEKLHILTHAFWYNAIEMDIYNTVSRFIKTASKDRYHYLCDNITDFNKIMDLREIEVENED